MSVIGNSPTNQAYAPATDYFSGNGSTTSFTLSRAVASVNDLVVVVENVVQNPGTAYTVSGNTLTFTGTPPSGTNNIYVRYTSSVIQSIQYIAQSYSLPVVNNSGLVVSVATAAINGRNWLQVLGNGGSTTNVVLA